MKAFAYGGAGLKGLEDRPKPAIQAAGAAIVKIDKTTIRGTDLHILKGTSRPAGRILRHEDVGIVDAVGTGVTASSTAHSRRLRNLRQRRQRAGAQGDHRGVARPETRRV